MKRRQPKPGKLLLFSKYILHDLFGFGANHREGVLWALIGAVKERVGCRKQCLLRFKRLTMCRFASSLAPPYRDGVEPETGRWRREQGQVPCRPHDVLDLLICTGVSGVLNHVNVPAGIGVRQDLQLLSTLPAPFPTPEEPHHFTGLILQCSAPIRRLGLPGSWDHHALAHRAEHG